MIPKRLSLITPLLFTVFSGIQAPLSAQDWDEQDPAQSAFEALTTPDPDLTPQRPHEDSSGSQANLSQPSAQRSSSVTALNRPRPLSKWDHFSLPPRSSLSGEPWGGCLILTGSSLTQVAQLYGVQFRHGAWTAQWKWIRPSGYQAEDEVGILTRAAVQSGLDQLYNLTKQSQIAPYLTTMTPPCGEGEAISKRSPRRRDPLLRAQLWVLAPSALINQTSRSPAQAESAQGESAQVADQEPVDAKSPPHSEMSESHRVWYYWSFENPHLSESEGPMALIRTVKRLVYQPAPPRYVRDDLLKPQERATLSLLVDQPADIWIDEVYQGRWPSHQKIYLPGGYYLIRAVPLDPQREPLSYEEVEVLRGRRTTFRIEFE